jgi:hypothetical protein
VTGEQHAGTPWPRFDSHHSCPKCGQVAFGISSQYQSLMGSNTARLPAVRLPLERTAARSAGEGVTGGQHADTVRQEDAIREAITRLIWQDRLETPHAVKAEAALNALLAENEFLKEQLEAQTQNAEHYLAENQRLRDALEWYASGGFGAKVARVALRGGDAT